VLGLVAHSLIAVLARSFYARQDTLTPVLAAVGAVVVNTTLAILLVQPLGLPGVALAIAIAAWLEAIALLVILRDRIPALALGEVGWVGVRTTLATIVATVAGAAVLLTIGPALVPDPTVVPLSGLPALIVEMVLVTAGFGAVFVVGALALRITELRSIATLMVGSLRRPASS
jgi:putative peptidoglycan lipid II flippase